MSRRALFAGLTAVAVSLCWTFIPAGSASAAAVKSVSLGLMDRGMDDPSQAWTIPDPRYLGSAINGYAVNIGWSELQPVRNGPIRTTTRLTKALSQVRAFNASHPGTHLTIRLRVFAGVNSPAWAMNLDGLAMNLRCDNVPVPFHCFVPGAQYAHVPRFWGPKYMAAYGQLMARLSSLYDRVPEIREIVASQCSTLYPETFLRQFYLPGNIAAYLSAGWSQGADKACMRSEIDIYKKTWPTTNIGLALNPYEGMNTTARVPQANEAFTESMMTYCRQALAGRCVLENYSTRITDMGPLYDQMYRAMVGRGGPLAYQTAIDSRVGDLDGTLCADLSIRLADDIELPRGYNDPSNAYGIDRTPDQLAPYNQALLRGQTTCP